MMKLQEHHLWLALAFLVALVAAYLSQGPVPLPPGGSPTAGLGDHFADIGGGLVALLVVGSLTAFAFWWRDRGGDEDELEWDKARDEGVPPVTAPVRPVSSPAQEALDTIAMRILSGIRMDPNMAAAEILDRFERLLSRAKQANALARDNQQLERANNELEAELDAKDEACAQHVAALEAKLEAAQPEWVEVLATLLDSDAVGFNALASELRGRGVTVPRAAREVLVQLAELKRAPATPSPTEAACTDETCDLAVVHATVHAEKAVHAPVHGVVHADSGPVHAEEEA